MRPAQQQDLFAQQLDLLAEPAPARDNRPPIVIAKRERANSPEVERDVLAIYAAHPGEYLDIWKHFRALIDRHQISGCFGHLLFKLANEGKLETKQVYFGAEHPGSPDYRGFKNVYRIKGGA